MYEGSTTTYFLGMYIQIVNGAKLGVACPAPKLCTI